MNEKEFQEKLEDQHRDHVIRSKEADRFRAQSLMVGTAGGGDSEITMRGINGDYLWGAYHPAEMIEIINQMAAAIGCHIAIKPREDFSSYREWKALTEEDYDHLNGHAPFPQVRQDTTGIGKGLLSKDRPFRVQNEQLKAELLAELKHELLESKEKEDVAAKKIVNKRSTKRSRTATE